MPGRGFLVFALAALLGAATTACQSNDTAVAGATAMRYLDALGAAPDRGWSLLTGSRTATDEASYTRALELLDWDQFTYEVTDEEVAAGEREFAVHSLS